MASISSHGGGILVRFQVRGTHHRTTVRRKPTTANLRAVRALCRDLEARLRAGEPWPAIRAELRGEPYTASRSLGYYAQVILDTAEVERTTMLDYQATLNRVWRRFYPVPVGDLLKSELQRHLATFDYAAKTRKNAISVLRRCFEAAKADGIITRAPTDHWSVGKEQKPEKRPYSTAERDQLLVALQAMDDTAYRYFYLGFYSGMRTSELLGLEWRHLVKPVARVEQVRVRQRIEARTKTHTARTVRLPGHVWTLLESMPSRWQKGFVFLGPQGKPLTEANTLMEHWHEAHTGAGVERRSGPYPWRHAYISTALANGVRPALVAEQTGHDLKTMFDRYAAFLPRDDDAEQIERAFTNG